MPSRKAKLQLEESWVVEGEGEADMSDYSAKGDKEESPSPITTPRRSTRGSNRSPEPEFVMPPLDSDTLEASWADTTSKNARGRGSNYMDREARRRVTQKGVNNRGLQKQHKIKSISSKASSLPAGQATTTPPSQNTSNFQEIVEVCIDHGKAMLFWAVEVLSGALRVLKTPISYLLAIWLLFGIGVVIRNLVTSSIYASLSPVCRIPGMSLLNLPFCPVYRVDNGNGDPPPVEFDQLMMVQSKFEEVLEDTAGNVALPMDMKRGEASIRDLRQVVRYSQLHSK